jgi:putative peptidoglycan lipid II flippase
MPSIGRAAVLLASSVLLSRLLGFAREALLAYRVGAGAQADAYYAAFTIPDLLNYFLAGGALSIAFLPRYSRHLAERDEAAAARFFSVVLGTLGVVSVAATLVLSVFTEPLVTLQYPGFSPEASSLTVHLTRIVLPAQVFFIAGGIANAVLMARGNFWGVALTGLIYNGGTILGGLVLAPYVGVEGFSWGALAGALLGACVVPFWMLRRHVNVSIAFAPFDRVFLGYLAIAAPLMLGQTLLTVDEWYERWFGARLFEGAVAHLSYARRLMMVPVAVVGQTIAQAALPTLSRLHAEGRLDELKATVTGTLRVGVALSVLVAGMAVFAEPLVELVYQRGRFTQEDAWQVAPLFAILCGAVPAFITQQIAVRVFYARGDTWRPMLLGTGVVLAAIPLYYVLGARFGVRGIALAGLIGMSVNALLTLAMARALFGYPELTRLGSSLLRSVSIALAAGLAGFYAQVLPPGGHAAALGNLALGGLAYAVVALVGVRFIGDDALKAALKGGARRLTRRKS